MKTTTLVEVLCRRVDPPRKACCCRILSTRENLIDPHGKLVSVERLV